jgi:hypothetical protein
MSDVQELGNVPAEGQVEAGESTATETTEAPKAPDTSWVPKRISEITAARRAAEERANRAEQELAALRAGSGTQEYQTQQTDTSQTQRARTYDEIAREVRETESMNSRIAAINSAGAKDFGDDYEKSVQNLQMAGIGGPDFLRALTKIDGAEKIVTYLGKTENLNDAMRIGSLDPVEMAIELTKMSGKAAKALSKQISKAPPPASTIDGGSGGAGGEPDPSDPSWFAWRQKNKKSRR